MGSIAERVVPFHRFRPTEYAGRTHSLSFARNLMRQAILRSADVQTSTEVLVSTVLADFAQADGTGIYPSIATLARTTRLTPRTIRRVLTDLLRRGVIVAQTARTGGHTTTRYDFGAAIRNALQPAEAPDTRSGDPGQTIRGPRTDDPPIRVSDQSTDQKKEPRTPSARGRSPSRSDVEQLLAAHGDGWQQHYGRPYVCLDHDRRLAREILRMLPVEEAVSRCRRYLKRDDWLATERGHSFGTFGREINSLAAERSSSRIPDAEQTSAYLAKLREIERTA